MIDTRCKIWVSEDARFYRRGAVDFLAHSITRVTAFAVHFPPLMVGTPIWFRWAAMALKVMSARKLLKWPIIFLEKSMEASSRAARPLAWASDRFVELPKMTPEAFFTASAALVRSEISRRSFSASDAYRCSTNGSTSAPSSATINGTRRAIRPEMNATSRLKRSSFATMTGQPRRRAASSAPARAFAIFHSQLTACYIDESVHDLKPLGGTKALKRSQLTIQTQPALALL